MNFWQLFNQNREANPGAIITIDPLAARADLIFGAPDTSNLPPSVSHLAEMPPRHLQGGSPFCVSYATTHLKEHDLKQTGQYIELEPDYTALDSHTGTNGNSVQAVLDTERKDGFVATADLNLDVSNIDYNKLPTNPPSIDAGAQTRAKARAWDGYAFLRPYMPEELKAALIKAPIGITFGVEGQTFGSRTEGSVVPIPKNPPQAYHCVVATGYNEQGIEVFDSLRVASYFLAWGYELTSAFVTTELPAFWQTTQTNNQNQEVPNNANRYGQVRNYNAEVYYASLLLSAFQAFKNKSVFDAAGRFWAIMIRACAYGGYTTTDCVNSIYSYRRTGKHIFDFDKPRK